MNWKSLMFACAFAAPAPAASQELGPVEIASIEKLSDCLTEQADVLDDGVSDAKTVAQAAGDACDAERIQFKVALENLFKRTFKEGLERKGEEFSERQLDTYARRGGSQLFDEFYGDLEGAVVIRILKSRSYRND